MRNFVETTARLDLERFILLGAVYLVKEQQPPIMAYCPRCMTEYREGAKECIDCHVALQPGSPPAGVENLEGGNEVKLVRVRTFSGATARLDADLAKNLLETQGIRCVLPGEFSAGTMPGIDVVQLLVREEDAEQAIEVLNLYLDSPETPPAD